MADGTVLGKTGGHMVGVVCRCEVVGVTAEAIRGCPRKPAANMTSRTGQLCMHPRQRETGELVVIEPGGEPTVKTGVTGPTIAGKLCRLVVRIFCALEIPKVARNAIGAQTFKTADCRILVTRLAVDGGMRPQEGEPVFVVLDGLQRYPPPSDRMALAAITSHLAPVDIRMAVGALHSDIGKYQLRVALLAVDADVHAAQGILGFVVIEIRIGPDRLPARRSVAIFTSHAERTVRATCNPLPGLASHRRSPAGDHEGK